MIDEAWRVFNNFNDGIKDRLLKIDRIPKFEYVNMGENLVMVTQELCDFNN